MTFDPVKTQYDYILIKPPNPCCLWSGKIEVSAFPMKRPHLLCDLENACALDLAQDLLEIGLAAPVIFFFGQMISGFDEKWFPLPVQQMD